MLALAAFISRFQSGGASNLEPPVTETFRVKANNTDLLVVNGSGDYLRWM